MDLYRFIVTESQPVGEGDGFVFGLDNKGDGGVREHGGWDTLLQLPLQQGVVAFSAEDPDLHGSRREKI